MLNFQNCMSNMYMYLLKDDKSSIIEKIHKHLSMNFSALKFLLKIEFSKII